MTPEDDKERAETIRDLKSLLTFLKSQRGKLDEKYIRGVGEHILPLRDQLISWKLDVDKQLEYLNEALPISLKILQELGRYGTDDEGTNGKTKESP
jgi:hypothetical protein